MANPFSNNTDLQRKLLVIESYLEATSEQLRTAEAREEKLKVELAKAKGPITQGEDSHLDLVPSTGRPSSVSYPRESKKNQWKFDLEKLRSQSENPLPRFSIYLVRLVGICLGILSIVVGFFIARGIETRVAPELMWAIYMASQFPGAYLLGFGKALDYKAWSYLGLYMTILFLVLSCTMLLVMLGRLAIPLSNDLVCITAINSLGIAILVLAEKAHFRSRAQ